MFKYGLVVLIIIFCFGLFLYGVFNVSIEVEPNACRMTYMFEQPQFLRVKFEQNSDFPYYGLYYYYEGNRRLNIDNLELKGAPVLFIPGNGGSYKQVRSLASVALRKGLNNDRGIHLDYFTIDYDEELSGLYGGYLNNQQHFLQLCIQKILSLYDQSSTKHRKKVVLIGHSMGGKIAQSSLSDATTADAVSTVIFISTPLDNPVVNIDSEFNKFYYNANEFFSKNREVIRITNETNFCTNTITHTKVQIQSDSETSMVLRNIAFISIGGGNRDLLVPAGRTTSQFSDIHAMTSSIPNVWLSCDHLSAVWCLQLIRVITRFLFDISFRDGNSNIYFIENKSILMQSAMHFFVRKRNRSKAQWYDLKSSSSVKDLWHTNSKRVSSKYFKNGITHNFYQMVPLHENYKRKKLYIEVINVDQDNWIYGCVSIRRPNGEYFCEKGSSLSHHVQSIPYTAGSSRAFALLDMENIKTTFSNWTHVLVHLKRINEPIYLNTDIHDPTERSINIKVKKWPNFKSINVINETLHGTIYYKLKFQDLKETYQTVQVQIEPIACTEKMYHITAMICVPWAPGFNQYKVINNDTKSYILVNVPIPSPAKYNTTKNPVVLTLHLDATCRYKISYSSSIANTMSIIVREFSTWLPAHLTAVLLLILQQQISRNVTKSEGQSLKDLRPPYKDFFVYRSIYMVPGCRLIKKLLFSSIKSISSESMIVTFIVHGTSIVGSIILSTLLWSLIVVHGNIVYKVALRIPMKTIEVIFSSLIQFPIGFGIAIIAIALKTSSGVALILTSICYFLMISNSYKQDLENWFWTKSINLLKTSVFPNGENQLNQTLINEAENLTFKSTEMEIRDVPDAGEFISEASQLNNRDYNDSRYFAVHTTLFLLLLLFTFLNVPSAIAWFKNMGNSAPSVDSNIYLSVAVITSLAILLQLNSPKDDMFGRKLLAALLYIGFCTCVIFCQEAIYRLNYVIASVFVAVAFVEIISL